MNTSVGRKLVASCCVGEAVVVSALLLAITVDPVTVSAQRDASTLLTVDYRETKSLKDGSSAPTIVEEGTYLIDPHGRYRIERRRGKSHTVEIVNLQRHWRTALDLDKKLAVTGPDSAVPPSTWSLPGAPIAVESEAAPQRQRGQPLGMRTLASGLSVEGVRFEFQIVQRDGPVTLTMDRWYYRFGDPAQPPVMLELRFEDALSITTREVLSVSTAAMDESLFQVPTGFSVARRQPDGGAHQ